MNYCFYFFKVKLSQMITYVLSRSVCRAERTKPTTTDKILTKQLVAARGALVIGVLSRITLRPAPLKRFYPTNLALRHFQKERKTFRVVPVMFYLRCRMIMILLYLALGSLIRLDGRPTCYLENCSPPSKLTSLDGLAMGSDPASLKNRPLASDVAARLEDRQPADDLADVNTHLISDFDRCSILDLDGRSMADLEGWQPAGNLTSLGDRSSAQSNKVSFMKVLWFLIFL